MRVLVSLFALTLLVPDVTAGPILRHLREHKTHKTSSCSTITTTSSASVSASDGNVTVNQTVIQQYTVDNGFSRSGVGTGALDAVNAKRAARGLRPFLHDPVLTVAAERCAAFRAEHKLFGHTGNDFAFAPVGYAASAGCAAYPASYGFMACCVYDNYTYAGAASVMGPDGRMYHHIFVR